MAEADNFDDDVFRPWHIDGFDQCGNEIYLKNRTSDAAGEAFRVLYSPEPVSGESDRFVRIYGEDEPVGVSPSSDSDDNEFHPFRTGIRKFDDRMSGTPAVISHDGADFNLIDVGQDSIANTENRASGNESVGTHANVGDSDDDRLPFSGYDEERSRGFEEGYRSGFEQGSAKGHEDGFARGVEDGMQKGYETGLAKGEEEGYDAGFTKGEEDGKVVGDAKALEILNSLEDIFKKSEVAWQAAVKSHESKILSLICRIAEKVVQAKVELDETVVKSSIMNALSTMPEPEDIVLNISPDDYDYIEMVKDEFFENMKSLKSVSVVSNPSVSRGGCKIESSKGKVETDMQSRLDLVFSAVMSAKVS